MIAMQISTKYKVILWNEGKDKHNPKKIVIYSSLEKYFDNYVDACSFKWKEIEVDYRFSKGRIEVVS